MTPIQWINYNRQISISAHKELLLLHKKRWKDTEQENSMQKTGWALEGREKMLQRSSKSAKVKSYPTDDGQTTELRPALVSHTTYSNSSISGDNWDVSNWGEEAIFPIKCLILQRYFLLPRLCLTSSYEPGMTCHWVAPHFSCTAASAAFGPTSSAFCQCYLLFSLLRHKAQAGKLFFNMPACPYPVPLFLLGHLLASLSCTPRLALCWPGAAGGCLVAPNTSYGTHRGQVKTLVLNCIT